MNRYTQLTPAQFSPLSLQEMMMVPLAKQKQYDSALAEISENKLFNNQYLDVHSDIVNKEIDAMTADLKGIEDELMSSGDVGSIKKRLVDLATRRKNFLSPQGIGGQAQAVRNQYLKNIEAINKDRTMRPEDKEWYKRNALNQYLQNQKAVTDGSIASYSDYSGYASRDIMNEAIKIASGITIDSDTFVNDAGTVENKKQRSKEFIYKNIMNQLGSDTNLINYLKETGYGDNYMQVLHNAAMNAANQKVVNESHLRGTRNGNGNGNNQTLRITSTGTTAQVMETAIGSELTEAVKSVDAYNKKTKEWRDILINGDDEEKRKAKTNLSRASTIYKVADKIARKSSGLGDNELSDVIIDYGGNESFDEPKKLDYIKQYLKNPDKFTISESDGITTLQSKNPEVVRTEYNTFRTNPIPLNITLDTKKLNNFKKYQEELDKSLANDALIPSVNLMISSYGPKPTGGENILKSVNNLILKTIKMNMKKSDIDKIAENDKELFELFYSNSGNHQFTSLSQSDVTGDIFINIEVDTGKKLQESGKNNIIQIPITRLGKDGNIPHAYTAAIEDLKSYLGPNGKRAIGEMVTNFKLKNVIVDTYSSIPTTSKEIFNKEDSTIIKSILEGQSGTVANALKQYDNFKIISQKNLLFNNEEIEIPFGYQSLIFSKKGESKKLSSSENEYLTINDYLGNYMERSGATKEEAIRLFNAKIKSGEIYLDDKTAQKYFMGQTNDILNYPLIANNKANLLRF